MGRTTTSGLPTPPKTTPTRLISGCRTGDGVDHAGAPGVGGRAAAQAPQGDFLTRGGRRATFHLDASSGCVCIARPQCSKFAPPPAVTTFSFRAEHGQHLGDNSRHLQTGRR